MRNKKIIAIISGFVIFALAVVAIVSVSAKEKTPETEASFIETIADVENKQTLDNSTTLPMVMEETSDPTSTEVETTAKLETTTRKKVETTTGRVETTTKKPVNSTVKKPIESTTKAVTTTKVASTTQTASRSLLQANDIPGKYPATSFEKAFFNRVNSERTKRGLPALIWNDNLHALSGVRSKEIVSKWGHERPNGKMPVSLMDEYNISYTTLGENLVGGTQMEEKYVDALVEALMNSPGHRENILATKYKYTAVSAAVNSDGVVYVAQLFYTP